VAKIELTPTELIVHIIGMDKLWSLRSQLRIPLDHVRDVTLDTEIARAGPQPVRLLALPKTPRTLPLVISSIDGRQ
jgi:hypothetical protein